MANPGAYPVDASTKVGQLRIFLGDINSVPLEPPVTGQADAGVIYGMFLKSQPEKIRYIGLTTQGIEKRFAQHLTDSNRISQRSRPVCKWINKHGRDNVDFIVIQSSSDIESLNAAEIFWIARAKSLGHADLNLRPGGHGSFNREFTEEHKAKISARLVGRIHSEESRKKMSISNSGKVRTPEMRQAQSERFKELGISRGEANPKAKLSVEDVQEIRSLKGTNSSVKVGKMFSVSHSTIGRIWRGEIWNV